MPDSQPTVGHPSRYVPLSALAIGEAGEVARPVGPLRPLPCAERGLDSPRPLVEDEPQAPGRAVLIECEGGGRVHLSFESGALLPLTLAPGLSILPLAATGFVSSGRTAVFSAWILD